MKDKGFKKFIYSFDWYQSFDLPNFKIKGRFRTDLDFKNPKIMPKNLKGKTWLDVGCNSGLICIEAALRGAKKVVGVEVNKVWFQRAKKLASFLNLKEIEYYHLDALGIERLGTFDFVSCFSLIHLDEVEKPFEILKKLKAVTKKILILEIHTWELKLKILRFPWFIVLKYPFINTNNIKKILEKELGWQKVEYLGKSAKNRDLFCCYV